MSNIFCKYEDPDTQRTFVITDRNKQPLSCGTNNKCRVGNCKKIIDNPSEYQNVADKNMFDNTAVFCEYDNDGKVKTYFDTEKYNVARFDGNQKMYYEELQPLFQSPTIDTNVLKQKCDTIGNALTSISKSNVDFPDKPLILQDDFKFCKFKDADNKTYVITDNNNQPLVCAKNTNKCVIVDFQKVINNQDTSANLYSDKIVKSTDLSCDYANDAIVSTYFDKSTYKITKYSGDETEFYKQYNAERLMLRDLLDIDELKRKHNAAKLLFTDDTTAQNKLPDAPPSSDKSSTTNKTKTTIDTTSPLFVALVFLLIFALLFIVIMIYLLITASQKQN
jgi:hypothetical protein